MAKSYEMISERDRDLLLEKAAADETGGLSLDGQLDFSKATGPETPEFMIAVTGLIRLIASRRPEINGIVTVADAATPLGDPIAEGLDVAHIRTGKLKNGGLYLPANFDDSVKRVVVVDNVFGRGEAAESVAWALNEAGILIEHVAVVADQSGKPAPTINQGSLRVPVNSLIRYSSSPPDERV